MRRIDCFNCGKNLAILSSGSKIRKEGFMAFCLACKEEQDDKNPIFDFMNGFRK